MSSLEEVESDLYISVLRLYILVLILSLCSILFKVERREYCFFFHGFLNFEFSVLKRKSVEVADCSMHLSRLGMLSSFAQYLHLPSLCVVGGGVGRMALSNLLPKKLSSDRYPKDY